MSATGYDTNNVHKEILHGEFATEANFHGQVTDEIVDIDDCGRLKGAVYSSLRVKKCIDIAVVGV